MTMSARMSFPADQKLLPFGSEQNHVQVTAASVWGCCISMERSYRRHTKPAGTTTWGRAAGRCCSRNHRLPMDRPLRHHSKAAGISIQARKILLSDMPSLNGSIALITHQSIWCYHTCQRRTAPGITTSQRDTLRKSVPKPPMLPRYCQENTALVSLLFDGTCYTGNGQGR
jgi:hypothetical protein